MIKNTFKKMPFYTRWDQLPILLDTNAAVVLLGMSEATVKRLAAAGRIPGAKKIGAHWRFDKALLKDYIMGEGNNYVE